MTIEITNLFKKAYRLITTHIGSGGNAHSIVNKFNAGFMSSNQLADLANAKGSAVVMPSGTDVLTLDPGKYEIVGALNNPVGPSDNSFIQYTVYNGGDGRKIIMACITTTGATYMRTMHTGGASTSGSNGWLTIYHETPVWSGLLSSGSATLSQPGLSNNEYLIKYRTVTGQTGIVTSRKQAMPVISALNIGDTGATNIQFYEAQVQVVNGTIKIITNVLKNLDSSGLHDDTSNATPIQITEVDSVMTSYL